MNGILELLGRDAAEDVVLNANKREFSQILANRIRDWAVFGKEPRFRNRDCNCRGGSRRFAGEVAISNTQRARDRGSFRAEELENEVTRKFPEADDEE